MTAPRILGQNSPPQNPNSRVIGWHFDYLLRIGPVANGQTVVVDLPILPGAPFCHRAIGGYNVAENSVTTPLSHCFVQWTDPNDQWLATEQVGISGDWPGGGLNALYEPVYQQMVYGPGSVIQVRFTNNSGGTLTDPRLVFRGTKLYYRDRIYSVSYPECYTSQPYEFPVNFDITPSGAGQTFRGIPLQVTGADFVFRGATLSLVSGAMSDLEFQLLSQDGRPHSSDFIHHAWLFSTNLAERPGIFYPEIYLPKDKLLLFDVFQGANAAFNVQLNAIGARIFAQ